MKTLILAAGYAIRLKPLTLNTPKPLLAVGKRAIVDRILDKIERLQEADIVHVLTNQKFISTFETWRAGSKRRIGIRLINDGSTSDDNKLGAIGDLKLFIDHVGTDDDILIIAGDNLFEFDLRDFVKFAKAHTDGASIALHDVKDRELAKKYGVVHVDSTDQHVIGFEEKPREPKTTLVSTCVYYFPKGKMRLLDAYIRCSQPMDAPGNFIRWLKDNDRVYGFVFGEDWFDIGGIESYREADQKYTDKK